jgi:hypothetical protein
MVIANPNRNEGVKDERYARDVVPGQRVEIVGVPEGKSSTMHSAYRNELTNH